ncbi:DnaJ domain [Geosmithia morbida]|uniref:DnaJ domain n=1 Tax=Geosmithia morbida TaxID=1094350 RepID=A0A9P4Z0Y0_9HYPO|nr:DnaJ domain [Geosmithia morbida]KAF4126102.1 DnaJ domain [Geosmithia morbida]
MLSKKQTSVLSVRCCHPLTCLRVSPRAPQPLIGTHVTTGTATTSTATASSQCCRRRWYATAHHGSDNSKDRHRHSHSHSHNHHQRPHNHHHRDTAPPPAWPKTSNPSPYEIFAIGRSEPYPKRRFYQLVKLYHPDLSHAPVAALVPPDVRIERYRLVVAANILLSDPVKRRAYDVSGAGWGAGEGGTRQSAEEARAADRSWRQSPGNASRNATWEDWEQWYEARGEGRAGRARQETQYMPNGVFAMLLAMSCLIGAMLQSQRAGASGSHYLEVRDQNDQAVGQEMRRSSMALAGLSKDERVDRFLRDRENVAFHFHTSKYEEDSLPPPPSSPPAKIDNVGE